MAIKISENVRFKIIPVEMLSMFEAILNAAAKQGKEPTITGASYEAYPKGKVHDRGYAIDIRTFDIPDPHVYAEDITIELGAVSPHYVVLYGDERHTDHIHIGFSWFYSHDNRREVNDGKRKKLGVGDQSVADPVETVTAGRNTVDQGSVRGQPL